MGIVLILSLYLYPMMISITPRSQPACISIAYHKMFVSIYPSLYLSLPVCSYLSIYLSIDSYLFINLSIYHSIFLSIYLQWKQVFFLKLTFMSLDLCMAHHNKTIFVYFSLVGS